MVKCSVFYVKSLFERFTFQFIQNFVIKILLSIMDLQKICKKSCYLPIFLFGTSLLSSFKPRSPTRCSRIIKKCFNIGSEILSQELSLRFVINMVHKNIFETFFYLKLEKIKALVIIIMS